MAVLEQVTGLSAIRVDDDHVDIVDRWNNPCMMADWCSTSPNRRAYVETIRKRTTDLMALLRYRLDLIEQLNAARNQ
jgi:hypothetical protein